MQHQETDAQKTQIGDFLSDPAESGKQKTQSRENHNPPAEKCRKSAGTRCADYIAAQRRKKIPAEIHQHLDLVILSLALTHCTDCRKEHNRAHDDPESHAPYVPAERDYKLSDSQLQPGKTSSASAVSAIRNRRRPESSIRQELITEKELKHKPDAGEQTIESGDIPVTENTKGNRQRETPDSFSVEYFIHAQQDQGQHVHTVQPHDVTALRNLILHQRISHRQRDHKDRADPVGKTSLQIPGKSCSRSRQLQGNGDIEKAVDPFFSEKVEQKIERGRKIIAEHSD